MLRRQRFIAALFLVFVLVLAGCGSVAVSEGIENLDAKASSLTVTVSILPQRYFVERIGGENVDVNVMVGPGDSPHSYEPLPEQMRALAHSTVYFTIGVEFEDAWLDKIASANEKMRIVDTTATIVRLPLSEHHHGEEEPGENASRHEEGLDPHVWTSPALVKAQAQVIYETLAELDPEHEEVYASNLKAFLGDIDALEANIRETLADVPERKFMVFHPSWGYFARDFGLEQIAVEVGGQEPSAQELAALIAEAKEEQIKVIFAQPEFSTRSAETIASEIGGEVLLISPLAPDWLDNMRRVADAFAAAAEK